LPELKFGPTDICYLRNGIAALIIPRDRRSAMRARVLSSAVVVVLFCWRADSVAQAPAAAPAAFLILSVIDVKPDMFAEFGELQAQVMEAQRKGGLDWRETWTVATFGRPYRVGVLTPLSNFAELDGQSFTVKGAGAEKARAINERARQMIVGQQIYALHARPDLGFGTRTSEPTLAVVSTITVAPGRNAAFEAIVKSDVVPAHRDAGEPYLLASQIVLGGDANQYLFVAPQKDFAGLQKGTPMSSAPGAERFAHIRGKLSGVVNKIELEVVRFNPALSYHGGKR
jgi:hypothetical protein